MSSGLREKTPFQSRGILVAVVVVFSSLSFSLGYFVGKMGREETTDTAPQIAEARQPAEAVGDGEVMPQKTQPPESPATATEKTPEQNAAVTANENTLPAVQSPEPANAVSAGGQTDRLEKTGSKKTGRTNSAEKAKESAAAARAQDHGVKYTVQLGALKSPAEAKKLKSTFLRKGYKAYISSSSDAGSRQKIYKVRTGEFGQRKDAEVLALKINKSEGIKSFVTPKD